MHAQPKLTWWEYGRVLPGPGEEQQWFETLPQPLRERLATLGIDQHKFQL
ncbi:Uncharacterised protein [Ewingella americana]|uniref:Uncharacterized protein n=1 Tax=Ewingella americana TaxID=41202 RepID=A0A377TCW8_9GAMM|nr:Uncharacterised protein [Ewingella americana]